MKPQFDLSLKHERTFFRFPNDHFQTRSLGNQNKNKIPTVFIFFLWGVEVFDIFNFTFSINYEFSTSRSTLYIQHASISALHV